MGAGEDL